MAQRGQPAPWLAYGCLAASMALVGTYVGLSRVLVAVIPVFLLAWLRFGIAAVAMIGWVRRQPGEPALSRHDRKLLFWESFLGNFLFSICMLSGVQATSAVAAGVVMAAMPAAVALMSWGVLGERISLRVGAGIACAVAGIGLLAGFQRDPHPENAAPWWGYLLLVGERHQRAATPHQCGELCRTFAVRTVVEHKNMTRCRNQCRDRSFDTKGATALQRHHDMAAFAMYDFQQAPAHEGRDLVEFNIPRAPVTQHRELGAQTGG